MNELLQATGYAAVVYLIFNYLVSFGSGQPLVEWINPGRRYLPILAFTLAGGAYTTLLVATRKYHQTHAELLFKLVSEERAAPEVVGGLSFVIFALALVLLYLWCWWFLPRAPGTFNSNPRDLVAEYRRALRHFVKWDGGLDFAILCEIEGGALQVVADGSDDPALVRGLNRLPGVHTAVGGKSMADVEAQKAIYRAMAADLFARWKGFDDMVAPGRQGATVGVSFDVRYGAVFAEMIEEVPTRDGPGAVGVFLFAAAMNQHEVNNLTAARHFAMLSRAMRHVRSGVAKG